jgi:hypothetical protein
MSQFLPAVNAVNAAIEKISLDYSVQVQFGKRWFSNSIRNIILAERQNGPIPPIVHAAVCAAGPSLDGQIDRLHEKRAGLFIIATDTAFLTLTQSGITPDAVIAIDCQHIGYRHFLGMPHTDTRFFLDMAAPPHLASFSASPYFFADSHPFSAFVSKYYKSFPHIDVSGGNVTYAAVSLAAALQAQTIELYGADFSYPQGKTYTQGAYIYPYFDYRQNRLEPTEALFSSFIFRSNGLTKKTNEQGWFYQTPSLAMYKNSLSDYGSRIKSTIVPVAGDGDGVAVLPKNKSVETPLRVFSTGAAVMKADAFLRFYRDAIAALPSPTGSIDGYLASLSPLQTEVLCTLIPSGASVKADRDAAFSEVLEETKRRAAELVQKVLAAHEI